MINIKEKNKALCFQDSTPKPLRLYMYKEVESDETPTGYTWRLFRVLDEEIILESANFTEGILEGEKFSLGSFVIPEMTIEWRNDGIRYKDFVCVPVQQIGDEYIGYEYIAYFNGYVAEETINTNGTTVKAKIKSLADKKMGISLNNIIPETDYDDEVAYIISQALENCGLISFDDKKDLMAFEYLAEKLKENFENAKITLSYFQAWEFSEILPKLTLKDLLKQSGEFLGCQVLISSKNKVNIEELKSDQSAFYEGIDFVKIPQVSDLTETPIYQPPYYMNLQYDKTPLLNENIALLYQSKIQALHSIVSF